MKHRKDQEEGTLDTPMDRTGIRDRVKESISSKSLHPHGSNCSIAIVNPDDLNVIWDMVEPYLEAVIEKSQGEAVLEDYYEHISTGDMQLWVAIESSEILACMVTQIAPYPSKRVLRIISLGGMQMDSWIEFLPDVEHWAMGMGCSSLELWGRKGWLKILKDWECSYHVLTKDLKGRMH
tara:strand:+ start:21 stop:557 length:537 start_codon:yes stop_codon:yes gene_type:complete